MVELQKKYNLKVNNFGLFNFVGFISLYSREFSRFFILKSPITRLLLVPGCSLILSIFSSEIDISYYIIANFPLNIKNLI